MIGIPIMRIAGIEIRVHLSWAIVIGLIAVLATSQISAVAPGIGDPLRLILAVLVGVGFFVSALIHDLGHALVARSRGVEVPTLIVSFFGGTTPLDPEAPDGRSEALIAIAGPLTSLIVAGILSIVVGALVALGGAAAAAAATVGIVLAALNLLLGAANLVPAYPLDGGRLVRAVVWWRTGEERRGTMVAASVGRAIGWTVVGGGLVLAISGQMANGILVAVTGWFLATTARSLREAAQLEELLDGMRIDEFVERDAPRVAPGLTVDTLADGLLEPGAIAAAAVVGAGGLVGVIGSGQVRRLRRGRWATTRAEELMASINRTPPLRVGSKLWPAVVRLRRSGLDGRPVMDADEVVGMFTRRSVGLAIRSRRDEAPPELRA